jgi:DNA-binding Lrp family transcriptional regulator
MGAEVQAGAPRVDEREGLSSPNDIRLASGPRDEHHVGDPPAACHSILAQMTPLQFKLLNGFQRGFPLARNPFHLIAEQVGASETEVIDALRYLQERGAVSRVGAVFPPGRVGVGTLVALAAPPEQLEQVAALVSAHPEVNHNYQREHHYNLWFVAAASCQSRLDRVLDEIEAETGLALLRLRLLEEFYIDLGFDLSGSGRQASATRVVSADMACELPALERDLLAALQDGLEIVPRPFARIAAQAGLSEAMTLALIEQWVATGLIKRFGVIVRHRELGYGANAMCVWDVPDDAVREIGARLAREPLVTLCYLRNRALPDWPYNLFCMIHGRSRGAVERSIAEMGTRLGLASYPGAVLFSLRCFKQRGARYVEADAVYA